MKLLGRGGRRRRWWRSRWVIATLVLAVATSAGAEPDSPKVLRYVSSSGEVCFGRVLEETDGVPVRVFNLGRIDDKLCIADQAAEIPVETIERALGVAEEVTDVDATEEVTEVLPPDALERVVLAPVSISRRQLESRERFVIGIGYNYAEHAEEVGADEDTFIVFPKFVEPTGPYSPVRTGRQVGDERATPVRLLDYEAELALVLLEDLDLSLPPPDYESFMGSVAFFVANDVSDREPIILDNDAGYTKGKSHPTYLPTGPWLIHGRHLKSKIGTQGQLGLEIGLKVREPCPHCPDGGHRERLLQSATTGAMIRGPWQIVAALGERYRGGGLLCMRDAGGTPRYVHDDGGIVPAGSIVLTGTPSGTAIQKPGLLERIALFVRGGLSVPGARQEFIADTEADLESTTYLEAGDEVHTWIRHLGRQRWSVREENDAGSYGIDGPGRCD